MHVHLRRPWGACLLAGVVLTTAVACSGSSSSKSSTSKPAAAQFPVTLSSGAGSVTLTTRPTHVVSLSPTATEILFAIGAGEQVKAVDKNSNYPASAPHTTLDAYQLNAEAVARYQPDLVIASGLSPAQTQQLKALHLPVLDAPAATDLTQTYDEIAQLGKATGHQDGAATLVARMRHDIADLVEKTPKPPAGTRYYYELDPTYYSVTTTTFIGQLLKLLGVTSVADTAKGAAASGGYPQLSGEYVVKANPAYLFLADTKCCQQTPATVAKRPGWSSLDAVKAGRVVPIDDDIASRWGPRVVDLLRTVSDAMRAHPAS